MTIHWCVSQWFCLEIVWKHIHEPTIRCEAQGPREAFHFPLCAFSGSEGVPQLDFYM